jgi:catechol 2,3-dioxygenase-like lactoylglutathione lyase family enzyme
VIRREQREPNMPDTGVIETKGASNVEPAVRIAGLDHLVLRVGNLDRAIEFYEKVLNCRVERRLDQPKLVQLRAGASLIDLVPASASPGAAEDMPGRNMDHFAVRVDGFDAAALAAHLRRCGVAVGEVRERYGAEGYGPSLYISDPDGNTVELKGPATRGL